jgi:hypothetical protein
LRDLHIGRRRFGRHRFSFEAVSPRIGPIIRFRHLVGPDPARAAPSTVGVIALGRATWTPQSKPEKSVHMRGVTRISGMFDNHEAIR